jgi:hypothetical protein
MEPNRWAIRKLKEDIFIAAVLVSTWTPCKEMEALDMAEELGEILRDASEAAMPKIKKFDKKTAYWWTNETAESRKATIRARRHLFKAKQERNAHTYAGRDRIEIASREYKAARKSLRLAIMAAKAKAWQELLATLDKDSWGRPYQMVLNKLKGAVPGHGRAGPRTPGRNSKGTIPHQVWTRTEGYGQSPTDQRTPPSHGGKNLRCRQKLR